ncbi:MAG: hypothetical protein NUV56_04170 [Candidatus Uhrbacteria bacterium]|nr:hypothetical protein [Candidatus Uhrbacteria bacterium]
MPEQPGERLSEKERTGHQDFEFTVYSQAELNKLHPETLYANFAVAEFFNNVNEVARTRGAELRKRYSEHLVQSFASGMRDPNKSETIQQQLSLIGKGISVAVADELARHGIAPSIEERAIITLRVVESWMDDVLIPLSVVNARR